MVLSSNLDYFLKAINNYDSYVRRTLLSINNVDKSNWNADIVSDILTVSVGSDYQVLYGFVTHVLLQ